MNRSLFRLARDYSSLAWLGALTLAACGQVISPRDGGGSDGGGSDGGGDAAMGASCHVAPPPSSPGGPTCGGSDGCFSSAEVYVETQNSACAQHVCMVYHWDQQAHPEDEALREFCTCRCLDGNGTPGCTCPSGTRCVSVFVTGNDSIRGSYCIPDGL